MTDTVDVASSTTPKALPISEMFSKFAIAFKAKTFELFADESASADPSNGFSLLDSAEDFIPDQKVIILKPDQPLDQNALSPPTSPEVSMAVTKSSEVTQIRPLNTQLAQSLISSVFATISSFEASYLQLQTAHVPFNVENIKSADEALVSHLKRLSDFKQLCWNLRRNPDFRDDLDIGSCLEAQVEENQSKLRVLGTVSDRLQEEIDRKDNQVLASRKKLNDMQRSNFKLSERLSGNLKLNSSCDVSLSLRVFNSVFDDARRAANKFTKILIDLMRKAGWDLDLAAISVHSDIEYAKSGHNRFTFLSYVCLVMFRGFDSKQFGLDEAEAETLCNGHGSESVTASNSLKQLLEHVSSSPVELIGRNPQCQFSKFCEKKYQELIHPSMESSIFANLDKNEVVLSSWRSLSVFYESFVNMASSIWMLHKLAFSFNPVIEIFQVERGVDFSMVYMEDITRRYSLPVKTRMKVGFTVVPGFKIGRTIIQSKVYVCGLNCTE